MRAMIKKIARYWKKRVLVFLIFAILVSFFTRKAVVKVDIVKVARGIITQTISASGKVDAEQRADLTFQGSGRVTWVGVKKGDKVTRWQAVASLDTVALNAAFQQTRNTYRSLEAAAQKAEDDVKDHASDETFAQKSTRMAAQVARDNAYDSMKAAEQALKFAAIIAPFDGIIIEANPAYPGSNITPASAVYSIVNPETLFFNTEVNEIDVAKIKAGQKVKLALDAFPEREFEGTVERIDFASFTTSTGGTAYKVKINLPKIKDSDFRIGMNGDAEVTISTSGEVLSLASEAIIEDGDIRYVWKVDKAGKITKIGIEIGLTSIDSIEVKSGLKEGDLVVVRPSAKLKNGSRAKL